jgi:hypothetical protein
MSARTAQRREIIIAFRITPEEASRIDVAAKRKAAPYRTRADWARAPSRTSPSGRLSRRGGAKSAIADYNEACPRSSTSKHPV